MLCVNLPSGLPGSIIQANEFLENIILLKTPKYFNFHDYASTANEDEHKDDVLMMHGGGDGGDDDDDDDDDGDDNDDDDEDERTNFQ